MSTFTELPADRQAVLSLLVKQGRSYAQVAGMLKIEDAAVRSRALDAVSALGGAAPEGLGDIDRERIADYLLGQLDESERIETLALLLDTSSGRAWARRISSELEPVAPGALPAVPDDLDGPAPAHAEPEPFDEEDDDYEPRPTRTERRPARRVPVAGPADEVEEPHREPAAGSPLALGVLGVAAALIVAAIIVFATGSSGSSSLENGPIPASAATATTPATTPTGATTGATGAGAVSNEVGMRATSAGGQGTGAVAVLTQNGQKELAFTAQKLAQPPAGDHYVLWLYNSASQFKALGEIQTVTNGTVSPVAVALPSDASSYTGIILTLESSQSPTKPGTIILQGQSNSPF